MFLSYICTLMVSVTWKEGNG